MTYYGFEILTDGHADLWADTFKDRAMDQFDLVMAENKRDDIEVTGYTVGTVLADSVEDAHDEIRAGRWVTVTDQLNEPDELTIEPLSIIQISTLVYGTEPRPKSPEESRGKHDKILADLNAPIEHTRCEKISHDTKTDRYVATFRTDTRTATLKITNEVAAFLAVHQGDSGYWRLRMDTTTGAVTDAYLVVAG